jgi:hypothetical protein
MPADVIKTIGNGCTHEKAMTADILIVLITAKRLSTDWPKLRKNLHKPPLTPDMPSTWYRRVHCLIPTENGYMTSGFIHQMNVISAGNRTPAI